MNRGAFIWAFLSLVGLELRTLRHQMTLQPLNHQDCLRPWLGCYRGLGVKLSCREVSGSFLSDTPLRFFTTTRRPKFSKSEQAINSKEQLAALPGAINWFTMEKYYSTWTQVVKVKYYTVSLIKTLKKYPILDQRTQILSFIPAGLQDDLDLQIPAMYGS